MAFVRLHVNSVYTYLGSALTVKQLVKNSENYAALTDFNSLVASVSFFRECAAKKIKPILGLDLKIDDNLLTFIVKNEEGYKNLLYLSKLYNTDALTLKTLTGHTKGLAVVISSIESSLYGKLENRGEVQFAYYLKAFDDAIEDFYIGLEIYNDLDKKASNKLRSFALKRNYCLLAFPYIRYLKKSDEIVYRLVKAIQEDSHLDESVKTMDGVHYFYSDEEINALYEPSEIALTEKLAQAVDFHLIKKRGTLIHYSDHSDELLKETAYRLLAEKVEINEGYQKRLDYELDVIKKMGYSDYFLIVMDYVKFAKDHQIYVGPGRGSAGGSLVAYALDIITIDPIKAHLLFERFLNPGRLSMPDIDVDFEDTRREEVATYLRNKYGKNRVGNIITSQTIMAKQALRDIGRVYQIKDSYIELLCKATGGYNDLHNAYRYSPAFKRVVDSDPYYLFIVTMASKIEGFPRQAGMHAAGVIINDEPLDESIPVYIDGMGNYLSQFEKDDLETLGYLKMDVLGLRNLTIVRNVIESVNDPKLTYQTLPYDDTKAVSLIATAETIGLFQLESKGMIRTIKEFRPRVFEDVVSLIALYRPGPMKFIPSFIARKEGKEKIIYPSNKIIDILKPTYGIIVYQEQIMEIVRAMAGFSFSEADSFRRAISKKNESILASLKSSFIERSIKNGSNQKESEEVFNLIYRFANYGFNRSHAYAYAKLANQMAYLKYHYPAAFYAAVLDNGHNFNEVIREMRTRGLTIALPDINLASDHYQAVDKKLVMPLISIRGILSQAVMSIIKEREEHGLYRDFVDFVVRAVASKVSATTIMKLIDAGAFDNFKLGRSSLRAALDKVMEYARLKVNSQNQLSLDDSLLPAPRIKTVVEDEVYNLDKEFESLGVTLSKSPLDFYQEAIKKAGAILVSEIKNQTNVKVAGMIKSIRRIKTKKDHKSMCFMSISDNLAEISVTVFSDLYGKFLEELSSAKIVIVTGRIDRVREELIASDLEIL
ncbi:MAG: DNA polymerase III subunit alpha [Bacilli bacterium]|nr:DNA polymerase III subunit alpha [Bacilli bacterium]